MNLEMLHILSRDELPNLLRKSDFSFLWKIKKLNIEYTSTYRMQVQKILSENSIKTLENLNSRLSNLNNIRDNSAKFSALAILIAVLGILQDIFSTEQNFIISILLATLLMGLWLSLSELIKAIIYNPALKTIAYIDDCLKVILKQDKNRKNYDLSKQKTQKIDDEEDRYDKLERKVWTTKKIRMHAEQRRIQLKKQCGLFLNTVTILSLILSFLSFFTDRLAVLFINHGLSYFSFILSVLTVTASLIITNLDFSEEANQFHQCYVKLYQLEFHISELKKGGSENFPLLTNLENEYISILKESINHTDIDRLYFKCSNDGHQKKFVYKKTSFWDKVLYIICRYGLAIVNIILLIFSVCVVISFVFI